MSQKAKVIRRFVLGRRKEAERLAQAVVIEPPDPLDGRELELLDRTPAFDPAEPQVLTGLLAEIGKRIGVSVLRL